MNKLIFITVLMLFVLATSGCVSLTGKVLDSVDKVADKSLDAYETVSEKLDEIKLDSDETTSNGGGGN